MDVHLVRDPRMVHLATRGGRGASHGASHGASPTPVAWPEARMETASVGRSGLRVIGGLLHPLVVTTEGDGLPLYR
jgi:hypothetical protein